MQADRISKVPTIIPALIIFENKLFILTGDLDFKLVNGICTRRVKNSLLR